MSVNNRSAIIKEQNKKIIADLRLGNKKKSMNPFNKPVLTPRKDRETALSVASPSRPPYSDRFPNALYISMIIEGQMILAKEAIAKNDTQEICLTASVLARHLVDLYHYLKERNVSVSWLPVELVSQLKSFMATATETHADWSAMNVSDADAFFGLFQEMHFLSRGLRL